MLRPTKNLSIVPFEQADMPVLKKWFYSGEYKEFFRDMLALKEDQLKIYAFMKDGDAFIVWKDKQPIGFMVLYDMRVVSANVKLSILIDKEHQHQGLCLEAMVEILNYAFNRLRMKKVIIEIMQSNARLCEMVEVGGFQKECVLKSEAKLEDKWEDVIRYFMFDEQYNELKKNFGG
jgi:RimJ/RimL family protein N-acetyltransferase